MLGFVCRWLYESLVHHVFLLTAFICVIVTTATTMTTRSTTTTSITTTTNTATTVAADTDILCIKFV